MIKELEDLMCRHPKVAKAAADGAEPAAASIVLDTEGSAEQILSWLSDPATGVPQYLKPRRIAVLERFAEPTAPMDCHSGNAVA